MGFNIRRNTHLLLELKGSPYALQVKASLKPGSPRCHFNWKVTCIILYAQMNMELAHVHKQQRAKTSLMVFGTNVCCFSKARCLSSPLSCTQVPWPASPAPASWPKISYHSMKTLCCGVPCSSDWSATSSQMLETEKQKVSETKLREEHTQFLQLAWLLKGQPGTQAQ